MDIRVFVSIVLAIFPVVNFVVVNKLSKRKGKISLFRKHFTCFYVDWIFVLFNLLWIYVVEIDFRLILILFLVSLLFNIISHYYWIMILERGDPPLFGFRKMSSSGVVHFIFSTAESTLIFVFLVSKVNSLLLFLEGGILILFFLGVIYGSRKINGRVLISDLVVGLLGIIITLFKIFWLLYR